MFPAAMLTCDCFLAYARARIDQCAELAAVLLDKLAFIEIATYTTYISWEAQDATITYAAYRANVDAINDALRSIECAMPALHTPDTTAVAANDISVALRTHCHAVRDLLPPLLRLRIPEVDAALSAAYDGLQRQLEHVERIQHRVLILVPILRRQYMASPPYVDSWNQVVDERPLDELVYLCSVYENRLLRFRVESYVVDDAD
jgi:hypothetical protein